jgi:hypothetical protein
MAAILALFPLTNSLENRIFLSFDWGYTMSRLISVSFLAAGLLLIGIQCSWGPKIKDGVALSTTAGNGKKISLQFTRGDFWMHQAKLGMMELRIAPQMAVWVEDSLGYVATLYVTRAFGKQIWNFAKINPDSCGRPMCMPYWLNRLRAKNIPGPTKNKPLPDAITGATPTGSFTLTSTLPEQFIRGTLFVEINKSFDNNNAWPAKKDMSSFNGQPPLVYKTVIDLGDSSQTSWDLSLSGMSGERESDAGLYPVDSRVTTALAMLKSISAKRL